MNPDRPTTPEPILTTARWSSALERLEERMLMAADVDVALIDRALPDHAILVRAMQPGGKVFLYDGENDSAEQILSRLTTWAEKTGNRLRSISLMSHGAAGRFALGNDWITKANLDQTEDQWQRLGKVLARGATINLFGCNLIDGRGDGKVLINRLSKAVGATVFASTDLTGRGGDWVLEAASRGSRARLASHPFSVSKLSRWGGNLASSLGSEFLVNTTTINIQRTHEGAQAVATDANGNFVIVWSGQGPGDTAGIFAQRYNALGVAQGPEFRVNTTTTGTQTSPAVAMNADGDFIVVWSGEGSDDTAGIFAQRFNASGVAQGGEFRINTTTADVQTHPSVAMSDAGSFVISWTSANQDGAAGGIYAQRYDAAGVAQGSEFLVNFVTTANDQDHSHVAVDADGDFVIVWASVINAFFGWGIAGQRFDASGAALTTGGSSEFIINTSFDGDQRYPSIAISPAGAFVVTWQSQNGTQDGSGPGVYARQYDAAGSALTAAEFRVNVTTENAQQYPSVAMDDAGNFSISWQSNLQDGDGWGIYARDYNAAGAAQSGEYLVNATTSGSQQYSSMAMDANGDFVIAWSGAGTGDTDGVFARLYRSISAGITVAPTSGLTTTEAGGTTSFTVVLDHQPTSNVTVTLMSSDTTEGAISGPLTFTPDNWNVAQTVTITGANDFLDDGNVDYTITTTASSSDAAYDSLAATEVSVTNSDDDTAGITVNPTSGLMTTEAGGTATFTVVLTSEPTADVTVNLLSMNTGEGTVPISSLVFTSANWNIAQTVTVTGTDDSRDDGDIAYTIQTSAAESSDPLYNGMTVADVSLTNGDDDTAGIIVSPTSGLTTTEAGDTATFTVVLASQPLADVLINLASSNTLEGTLSTSSLTFTPASWNVAQTVTVTGVNELVDDGDLAYSITTSPAVSGDEQYDDMDPADVSVTNIDDDAVGITLTWLTDPVTTESGGTAQFLIELNSQPTSAVVISIDADDDTEGSATPNVYSLTTSNWNVPRTITVTGIDDALLDGDITYLLRISASSSDPKYNGLQEDLAVTNLDNDTPGITVSETALTVNESGTTATFGVRLDAPPTQDVLISLFSDDEMEGTTSATSLLFTPDNWNTEQFVVVTGVNDFLDDGDADFSIILMPAQSADANYEGLDPTDISVTNEDDDTAGITVSPLAVLTTESGGTASYTVVLDSQPISDVIVSMFSRDTTEGQVSITSLVFTPDDWDQPQTVVVTGVNDGINDGDIDFIVVNRLAESGDPQYDGLNPADLAFTNLDDDAGRVIVSLTTAPFTTEDGGAATLQVVLDSAPTQDVIVQLLSSDEGEGTLSTAMLVFTPDDWNIAQFVDVTGVDDDIVDGDVPYTIGFTTSSTDPDFDNLPMADVALTNRDTTVSPPAITTSAGTLYFTENDAPERIDDALVVADANGVLTSATIRIITNYVRGEDRLAFTNRDGISGVWNATTGTLLLTGTATVAQYQEALRSVTYENTSEDPSGAVRTVRFTISDDDSSASATKSVAVEPVNDAPAGVAESYSVSADSRLVTNVTRGVLRNDSDAEGDDLSAVLVSPPTFGELTLNPDGSFTYLAGAAGTYTFVYQTTDGQDSGKPVTVTITVNPAEEAPVIPGKPGDPPRPEKPPVGKPEVPARPEKPDKPEKPKSPPREKPRQSDPPVAPPMHVTPPPARTMSPPARIQIGVVARAEAAVMLTRAIYVEAETIDFAQHPVVVETRPDNPDVTTIDIAALPKWEITETLSNSLDQLADQLAAETQGPNTAAAVVGSAALVWVGYVVYSLRGGALLLTFLTSMPLWRTLDPLPVLEASEARAARRKNRKKRRSGDQDDPEERSLRSVLG